MSKQTKQADNKLKKAMTEKEIESIRKGITIIKK